MLNFNIVKKLDGTLARAGVLNTSHGAIETPALIVAATKATVKSVTPEQIRELGAQAVLANTYHLYLEPGDELITRTGGLHAFMNWNGPTFTDSGGFQAFSLGAALGHGISKLSKGEAAEDHRGQEVVEHLRAVVTEDGVTFKSFIDGSTHHFTPERSMQIQHNLGADIIFAFDECTSPTASYEYQNEAMERTHRWAVRSLDEHKRLGGNQALFGIVQGGRFQDLREISAHTIGAMDFPGFGIGGSFDVGDMGTAVRWVNQILPENKPRHLLGIGEPIDFFEGVENGVDTFDCVGPTRMARNGSLQTRLGRINIRNSQYREDFSPIEKDCGCYTCRHYTKAYIAHLFRAHEILAATLATIHNLYFSVNLVKEIRQAILDNNFSDLKVNFLKNHQTIDNQTR